MKIVDTWQLTVLHLNLDTFINELATQLRGRARNLKKNFQYVFIFISGIAKNK